MAIEEAVSCVLNLSPDRRNEGVGESSQGGIENESACLMKGWRDERQIKKRVEINVEMGKEKKWQML